MSEQLIAVNFFTINFCKALIASATGGDESDFSRLVLLNFLMS